MLFAKNLGDFKKISLKAVRVIIYRGKNRLQTIKEQLGSKGYAVGFEGLINYINDQLPTNEEIGKAFRKEVKMYSVASRIITNTINAGLVKDFDPTNRSKRFAKYIPLWALRFLCDGHVIKRFF